MKKTLYLLLLSLGMFAACKKTDSVTASNSNTFTYKITTDSTGTYDVSYYNTSNIPVNTSFTGKSWSQSFDISNNPYFKIGYFVLTNPNNVGGTAHLSILIGNTVKASTNAVLGINAEPGQLSYTLK